MRVDGSDGVPTVKQVAERLGMSADTLRLQANNRDRSDGAMTIIGLTFADGSAIVGAIISLTAVFATWRAALAAQRSAKSSEQSLLDAGTQWRTEKRDRDIARVDQQIGIVNALSAECDRLHKYYLTDGIIPHEMFVWHRVRVEVYQFAPDVGLALDEVDYDVLRHNYIIQHSEANYWTPWRIKASHNARLLDEVEVNSKTRMKPRYDSTRGVIEKALCALREVKNTLEDSRRRLKFTSVSARLDISR